jgi:hypothetical protein
MERFLTTSRHFGLLLCGLIVAAGVVARPGAAADYGRLSGTVRDTQGNPLMGATVMVTGPLFPGAGNAQPVMERILTDANGRYLIGGLMPGLYSLRVFSPTRLPAMRDHIRVKAGETSEEKFILGDIFAPLSIRVPNSNVSSWGDEWKWILRTSATTRPVLRFKEVTQTASNKRTRPLPPSQRLIGVTPGSARGEALAGDSGMGSVLAYFRPLSEGSDVLVAGSMNAEGWQASSVATAFRRNLMSGDPQELTLTIHQLSFADGPPGPETRGSGPSYGRAQAVVVSYARMRRVSEAMNVAAGFRVDYLAAATSATSSRPFADVEYRLGPTSSVSFHYGAPHSSETASLMDRIGDLNALPRVTLRNFRPELENLNHMEVSYDRRLGRRTRVEVAAYRDNIQNTALWASADAASFARLAPSGNYLPNPVAGGVTVNAGDFTSSGVRVAMIRSLGADTDAAFVYSTGQLLAVVRGTSGRLDSDRGLREFLRSRQSRSLGARVTTRVPVSHTRVTTSYQWLPGGAVMQIDPVGEADMDIAPFLCVQIRQPLPALDFFSARIEAMADFRNLLGEGYTPVTSSEERVLFTPAYRSFRGGFSVQF